MSTRGLDVAAVRCRLISQRPPRQKVNIRRSTLKIYELNSMAGRSIGATALSTIGLTATAGRE